MMQVSSMKKAITFIALLVMVAAVCGCSVQSSSTPEPTRTAVIPDQTVTEPTYTPLPLPSPTAPPTPTPRADQSFVVSNVNIHWETMKGIESDKVTFDIKNDGAQALANMKARYTVGVYTVFIDLDQTRYGETPHWKVVNIGTVQPDEIKNVTIVLDGSNAYSTEKPSNATLEVTWDGGSRTIFKKVIYNQDYSNGDITFKDSDLYKPPVAED